MHVPVSRMPTPIRGLNIIFDFRLDDAHHAVLCTAPQEFNPK